MPVISIKAGVLFEKVHQCILYAVFVSSLILAPHETVITSLRDGKHLPKSFHYVGRAVDLRTRHIPKGKRRRLASDLGYALGEDYDVILEKNPPHIHIEYEPKEKHNVNREETVYPQLRC